jgi:SPP1 family predicted phage head-tail adaptor
MPDTLRIDPGELDQLVDFEAVTRVSDGMGGYTTEGTWAPITDGEGIWARVRALRGSERLRAMQTHADVTHEVVVRYRDDVTEEMRVVLGARVLKIVSPPIDPYEAHEWLQLLCTEER